MPGLDDSPPLQLQTLAALLHRPSHTTQEASVRVQLFISTYTRLKPVDCRRLYSIYSVSSNRLRNSCLRSLSSAVSSFFALLADEGLRIRLASRVPQLSVSLHVQHKRKFGKALRLFVWPLALSANDILSSQSIHSCRICNSNASLKAGCSNPFGPGQSAPLRLSATFPIGYKYAEALLSLYADQMML